MKLGNASGGKGLINRCTEEVKQLPDVEPGNTLSTKLNRLLEIENQNQWINPGEYQSKLLAIAANRLKIPW